jgi:hypothetical protein
MQGVQRATQYGYSLWEMAVYGTPVGNQPPAVVNPASVVSSTATTASLSVLGDDLGGQASLTYTWSVVAAPAGSSPVTFSVNGSNAARDTTATFVQPGTYTLLATLQDAAGLTATSVVSVNIYGPNLALNKSATASSTENGGTPAGSAFDGNAGTRWSSQFSDNQWLQVDLGAVYNINRVTLNWENAYGKAYQIQVSSDGVHWTTIYSTSAGHGGVEDLTGLSGTGRYVRMQGIQRATQYGYSLWEMAVYSLPA